MMMLVGMMTGSVAAQFTGDPANGEVATDVNGCMQDVYDAFGQGGSLGCTANDVSLATATNIEIHDDGCAYPGDTVTFTAKFQVDVTAGSRNDVGIYFSLDGDPNSDGAYTGSCTVSSLPFDDDNDPSTTSSVWLDLDGFGDNTTASNDFGYCSTDGGTTIDPTYTPCDGGSPEGGDAQCVAALGDEDATCEEFGDGLNGSFQDICGDISKPDFSPLYPEVTLTVACVDDDGDGELDLPYCTSWRQSGANELCLSPLAAYPGAPSKCNCDVGFSIPIPVPGKIIVNKETNPDGDTIDFNFNLSGGPDSVNQDFILSDGEQWDSAVNGGLILYAGNYIVSETIPENWVLTSACTGDNSTPFDTGDDRSITPDNIDLKPGETVTCTFNNELQTGTLTLVKSVVNDNGGTATAADFQARINGENVPWDQAQTLIAGNYTASEIALVDGYTASDWGGDCAADGSVTINAGDEKTCTITNDDDAPSLTLVKEVTNDNGGTAVAGDWTLTAAGYDPDSPDAGTYNLSETGPANYTLTSLTCDNAEGQVTSVTLGLGEDVTCTFVNDDIAPTLTIIKYLVPTSDPGEFTFCIDESGVDVICSTIPIVDASQFGPVDLHVGSFTVEETAFDDNTDLSDYDIVIGGDCAEDGSISLNLADDKVCTITNSRLPQIKVNKVLVPHDDPGRFNLIIDDEDKAEDVGDGGTTGWVNVTIGEHTVGETAVEGTSLDDYITFVKCSINGGDPVPGDSVDLGYGDMAECTITNLPHGQVTDTSYCVFDREPDIDGRQFRLLFTPDVQNYPAFKLTASNPGQFYFSMFHDEGPNLGSITFQIPYPFVTQGAMPVHTYDDVLPVWNEELGIYCLNPVGEGVAYGELITLADYASHEGYEDANGNGVVDIGDYIQVTIPVDLQDDFVYANIHLDYGLKGGEDRYAQSGRTDEFGTVYNDAVNFYDETEMLIPDRQEYAFEVWVDYRDDDSTGNVFWDDDTVMSINSFKKTPGIAGFVYDPITGELVENALVILRIPPQYAKFAPDGVLSLEAITDEDGWYMIEYKHRGKPSDAYVAEVYLPPDDDVADASQYVALKGNAFAEVNFFEPSP
jgi:hypothetical protein